MWVFLPHKPPRPPPFPSYLPAETVFPAAWEKLTVTSCEDTVPLGLTATSTYLPALSGVVLLIIRLGWEFQRPATPSFFHW